MPKKSGKKLRVLVSSKVRERLDKVFLEREELGGIEFVTSGRGCDSELFLEEDVKGICEALAKKRVPIMPKSKKFPDFDPVEEYGVCFAFDPRNKLSLVDALVRARENHRFPYDWRNIVKEGVKLVKEMR